MAAKYPCLKGHGPIEAASSSAMYQPDDCDIHA